MLEKSVNLVFFWENRILLFEMAQKMANMGKNSHEGVYRLKMASSSLFVFFNVHTDGSKWDLRWTALDLLFALASFIKDSHFEISTNQFLELHQSLSL